MKNSDLILGIDFFRLRLQEIDDTLVEIKYELEEDLLTEKNLGNLNFAICMLYEEGIPFIEKLCRNKDLSINLKNYIELE